MTESSPAANGETAPQVAGAAAVPAPEEKFGGVVLTISNSVLPMEKLAPTPSSLVSALGNFFQIIRRSIFEIIRRSVIIENKGTPT